MNWFIKNITSKISFFIIGYEMSLKKEKNLEKEKIVKK